MESTRIDRSTGLAGTRLTDPSGKVVGYFVSEESFERMVDCILPEPTPAEIAEARREMLSEGGASAADILAAIRSAVPR